MSRKPKIQIKIDPNIAEYEIQILAKNMGSEMLKIKELIESAIRLDSRIHLTNESRDFYLPAEEILFFESAEGKTFAHNSEHIYETRLKLYELMNVLPISFVRAGKSVIVGTKSVLSIERSLTGPSLVQFSGSKKQIYVSRSYYKGFVEKLKERDGYDGGK